MHNTDRSYRLARLGYIILAKAGPRRLRAIDATTAHVPFPYDAHFFDTLRSDQVPRFLGALTDADRLPLQDMDMSTLVAIQDRVDPAKVEALRGRDGGAPVAVRMNGRNYIIDGHHRAAAAYLDGQDKLPMHFKDLTEYSRAVKAKQND